MVALQAQCAEHGVLQPHSAVPMQQQQQQRLESLLAVARAAGLTVATPADRLLSYRDKLSAYTIDCWQSDPLSLQSTCEQLVMSGEMPCCQL